jgi:CheY-like chemotaxis protein
MGIQSRKRVLVIDDDRGVREVIRLILEDYQVEEASLAVDVSDQLLAGDRYDVIICDLIMPFMTGAELHASLPESSPMRHAFIFMTGGSLPRPIRQFLETFAPPVLTKPFTVSQVKAAVAEVLG